MHFQDGEDNKGGTGIRIQAFHRLFGVYEEREKDFTHSLIYTYEHSKDDMMYMYRHFTYNLLCMIWRLYQSAFHII